MSDRLEELRRRHARAEAGGGEERRERQHAEGKLSARERIDLLLDIPPPSKGSTIYNKSPRSI